MSDTPRTDAVIPPALLESKLDSEYDDQDRRGLLAIIGTHKKYLRGAARRIEELERQLAKSLGNSEYWIERAEKAEQDARRYRWLRTAGAWESESQLDMLCFLVGNDGLTENPETFDEAIDAAMNFRRREQRNDASR